MCLYFLFSNFFLQKPDKFPFQFIIQCCLSLTQIHIHICNLNTGRICDFICFFSYRLFYCLGESDLIASWRKRKSRVKKVYTENKRHQDIIHYIVSKWRKGHTSIWKTLYNTKHVYTQYKTFVVAIFSVCSGVFHCCRRSEYSVRRPDVMKSIRRERTSQQRLYRQEWNIPKTEKNKRAKMDLIRCHAMYCLHLIHV